jgi:hypothetical protein
MLWSRGVEDPLLSRSSSVGREMDCIDALAQCCKVHDVPCHVCGPQTLSPHLQQQTLSRTHQDMAATAAQINASIEQRRHELAPLVKKLRAARIEKGSLEGDYNEKKAA